MMISTSRKKTDLQDQAEKWVKNNYLFGKAIENTKDYTDRRFDKKPRIKVNLESGQRYMDKAKFLTKFSCFDGYMQYVDTKWNDPACQGIDHAEFKR